MKKIIGILILVLAFTGCTSIGKPDQQQEVSYLSNSKQIVIIDDEGEPLYGAKFIGEVKLLERKSRKQSASLGVWSATNGGNYFRSETLGEKGIAVIYNENVSSTSDENGIIEITYDLPQNVYKSSHYADGGFSWDRVYYDYAVLLDGTTVKKGYFPREMEETEQLIKIVMVKR